MVDVLIDSQEHSKNKVFKRHLDSVGISTSIDALPVGDFMVYSDTEGKAYIFERKSASDFIGSTQSGRIFDQLKRLKQANGIPYIILDGSLSYARKYSNISISAVVGQYWSILDRWKIPVIALPKKNWTSLFLGVVSKSIGKERKPYTLRTSPPHHFTLQQKQEYLLQGLPGIGAKTAEKILTALGRTI